MRNFATLRRYDAVWFAFRTPYVEGVTQAYNAWFKSAVPMRAYDPMTKSWLLADAYVPVAVAGAVEHGLFTSEVGDGLLRGFNRELEALKATRSGNYDSAYVMLGVQPGAPLQFCRLALEFWRQHFASSPGGASQLVLIEEAFEIIGRANGIEAGALAR